MEAPSLPPETDPAGSETENVDEEPTDQQSVPTPELDGHLDSQQFDDWVAQRDTEQNVRAGYGQVRNRPEVSRPAVVVSPHRLLTCKRKSEYERQNAPAEDPAPKGVFYVGHQIEELIEEYLDAQASADGIVVNGLHVRFQAENGVYFDGQTDPVLVDRGGLPHRLFEVKSTNNIDYVRDRPQDRHRAQAHAYAKGLQSRYGLSSAPPITLVYVDKESLEIKFHSESFDEEFWSNTVLTWAAKLVDASAGEHLPPTVEPEREWLCGYCEYKERCGNHEPDSPAPTLMNSVEDQSHKGFLPLIRYPEPAVVEHLKSNPDVDLTPTVATAHPMFVTGETVPERASRRYGNVPQREVHNWVCDRGHEFEYEAVNWDGSLASPPHCPRCADDGADELLRGPRPAELA